MALQKAFEDSQDCVKPSGVIVLIDWLIDSILMVFVAWHKQLRAIRNWAAYTSVQ